MANPIKASDLYQDDGAIQRAIEQLNALSEEHAKVLASVKKEAVSLEGSVKKLNATSGQQRKEISESAKQADELAKRYEKYNASLSKNAQDIAAVKEAQTKLNQVNRAEARLNMAKEGSYNALSAQYTLLKLRINQLTKEERENTEEGRNMVKQSRDIYTEMKRLQEETGKTSLNVGNYKESIKEALQETGLFPGALGRVITQVKSVQQAMSASSQAIGGGSKALRAFKIALAATGIGLILVALGALAAYMTRTQDGIDRVNRALAGFKAVADVFIDRLSAIGRALATDFAGSLREAGARVGGFFKALVTFDWDKVKSDIGDLKDAFNGLKEEIIEEASAAMELEGQMQAVKRETQALATASARARSEIKRLNMIAEDTTKGYAERAEAAAKAGEIERNLLRQREALLQRELAIMEKQKGLGESLFEDDQELADKRTEIAQAQTESLELQTTIQNKLNTINAEAARTAARLNEELAEAAAILGGPAEAARLEYDRAIGKIQELRGEAEKLKQAFDFSPLETLAQAKYQRDMDAITLSTKALAREGMAPLASTAQSAGTELDQVRAIAGKTAQQASGLKISTKLTKDEIGALKGAFAEAKTQLSSYFQEAEQLANFQLQQAQQGVQAAQNELQIQLQLAAAGYASRVEAAQDELALARQTQAEAERQRQRAQRAQLTAQSIEQASNLITAISKLFAELPFFLALPASGVLFGTFAAAKIKAFQATRFKEGGYEVLEGGSHSSGRDIPLGFDSKGRQRRAEGGEGMAIFSRRATARYGDMLPSLVAAINRGEFEKKYTALAHAADSLAPAAAVVNVNTSGVETRLDALRRDGQRRTWQDGKGRTVEQIGNRKITYV
jgi:hypothetical protein